jgi:hypothetical protein
MVNATSIKTARDKKQPVLTFGMDGKIIFKQIVEEKICDDDWIHLVLERASENIFEHGVGFFSYAKFGEFLD